MQTAYTKRDKQEAIEIIMRELRVRRNDARLLFKQTEEYLLEMEGDAVITASVIAEIAVTFT